jgi:hypothetical protein
VRGEGAVLKVEPKMPWDVRRDLSCVGARVRERRSCHAQQEGAARLSSQGRSSVHRAGQHGSGSLEMACIPLLKDCWRSGDW